jgi:hypothetical protein
MMQRNMGFGSGGAMQALKDEMGQRISRRCRCLGVAGRRMAFNPDREISTSGANINFVLISGDGRICHKPYLRLVKPNTGKCNRCSNIGVLGE